MNGNGHYKPPFKFGMGGVPLGNEFEVVTDKDAYATLEAGWNAGVRHYDVAPWYGLGLAERRYGNFLHNQERSAYVLSTKVGEIQIRCANILLDLMCTPSAHDCGSHGRIL